MCLNLTKQRLLDKQPLLEMLLNGGVCKFRLWMRNVAKYKDSSCFRVPYTLPSPKAGLALLSPAVRAVQWLDVKFEKHM